jgi:hypothetical protein
MANLKPDTSKGIRVAIGVVLLLTVMATELALSARQQSQTIDEAVHVFSGYRYWKNFDFGFNPEHPPLVKLITAIPLLRMPLRAPSSVSDIDFKAMEYMEGRSFLYSNDAMTVLWRARMAAAAFTLCLALTVFLLAYSIWGAGPAFLALALVVFDPNILAHGALVTTDIGVTFGFFLGVASFYFYLKKPSALRLVGVGLAAGICLGAKHSGVLLFPMLLCLALAEIWFLRDSVTQKFPPDIANKALRQAASLAAIALISIVVLWSFYGFRYAARPAGLSVKPALPEFTQQMGSTKSAIIMEIAHLHLLPESYLYGLADISSTGKIPTVIFGKFYPSAQWFYFPSVFIVKSTLAFLVLCFLAPFGAMVVGKPFRREILFLTIPPAIYLAVAMSSGINYGVRHLLPIYPFLTILVSFLAWNLGKQRRSLAVLVAVLVAFHAVSSLRAFPNYIPYSNEFWGGSERTYEFLTDSNVDWGQGLIGLQKYIAQRHIKDCWFAYFGQLVADSSYYGIPCKELPTAFAYYSGVSMPIVPPQVDVQVFISASEVRRTYWPSDWVNPYWQFLRTPPTDLVAGSILVYDGKVDMSEVSALTHEQLAMKLMDDRKFDQALAEATTAIDVAPNRPLAHAVRGKILVAMGRKAEAIEESGKVKSTVTNILALQGSR